MNLYCKYSPMEVKTSDNVLMDATSSLKKSVEEINKEVEDQTMILEIIGNKAVENVHSVAKTRSKFDKAVKNLKSDYRNLVIMLLVFIIFVLSVVVFY